MNRRWKIASYSFNYIIIMQILHQRHTPIAKANSYKLWRWQSRSMVFRHLLVFAFIQSYTISPQHRTPTPWKLKELVLDTRPRPLDYNLVIIIGIHSPFKYEQKRWGKFQCKLLLLLISCVRSPLCHHLIHIIASKAHHLEEDDSKFSIFINVFSLTLLHSFRASFLNSYHNRALSTYLVNVQIGLSHRVCTPEYPPLSTHETTNDIQRSDLSFAYTF